MCSFLSLYKKVSSILQEEDRRTLASLLQIVALFACFLCCRRNCYFLGGCCCCKRTVFSVLRRGEFNFRSLPPLYSAAVFFLLLCWILRILRAQIWLFLFAVVVVVVDSGLCVKRVDLLREDEFAFSSSSFSPKEIGWVGGFCCWLNRCRSFPFLSVFFLYSSSACRGLFILSSFSFSFAKKKSFLRVLSLVLVHFSFCALLLAVMFWLLLSAESCFIVFFLVVVAESRLQILYSFCVISPYQPLGWLASSLREFIFRLLLLLLLHIITTLIAAVAVSVQ